VSPRPTVLILRALGLGDLLTAVPALRAIAEAFPDHRRVLAAPRGLVPIVELTGAVDEVLDARPFEPPAIRRPEVAVNLHGRGPQSHRMLLATEPERLIAFEHPDVPESAGMPRWTADEHEVRRWCRLLRERGIPADPEDLGLPAPEDGVRDPDLTVVHPGAASAARRWPPGRWGEVARGEASSGRRVVVTGADDEEGLARGIAAGAGLSEGAAAAGRTGLRSLASLVAGAGLVISGDTGVAHLATAFGTPSVVLFGPTPPARWGPPPGRPQHVALWAGETGDPHGDAVDPGLLRITVDDVVRAAARARNAPAPRRAPTGAEVLA
jgi:ADP-heptose:LPS heptosyltransferase